MHSICPTFSPVNVFLQDATASLSAREPSPDDADPRLPDPPSALLQTLQLAGSAPRFPNRPTFYIDSLVLFLTLVAVQLSGSHRSPKVQPAGEFWATVLRRAHSLVEAAAIKRAAERRLRQRLADYAHFAHSVLATIDPTRPLLVNLAAPPSAIGFGRNFVPLAWHPPTEVALECMAVIPLLLAALRAVDAPSTTAADAASLVYQASNILKARFPGLDEFVHLRMWGQPPLPDYMATRFQPHYICDDDMRYYELVTRRRGWFAKNGLSFGRSSEFLKVQWSPNGEKIFEVFMDLFRDRDARRFAFAFSDPGVDTCDMFTVHGSLPMTLIVGHKFAAKSSKTFGRRRYDSICLVAFCILGDVGIFS